MKLEWIWQNELELPFMTIQSWRKNGIDFLFSGRHGGISQGDFHSLNLGLHVGDSYTKVIENRRKIMRVVGQPLEALVSAEQVHGAKVAEVSYRDRGRGAFAYEDSIQGIDALITGQAGVYLALFFADCIPLGFFDPVRKVIGLAHGGWKGTRDGIAVKTVNQMGNRYGCRPEDVQAVIGPGISSCCFVIQPDLAESIKDTTPLAAPFIYRERDIWYWDLKATNRKLLIQAGLKAENIKDAEICTACCTERFFSYRKEKGRTGRMAAIMGIRE